MDAVLEGARHWANTMLVWIGFGTVVGLIARALLPGKGDQGGTLATLVMGIVGSVIGMGALAYFWHGHRATPVSLLGFVAATAGASLLLFCHRMLQGSLFRDQPARPAAPVHHRRAVAAVRER